MSARSTRPLGSLPRSILALFAIFTVLAGTLAVATAPAQADPIPSQGDGTATWGLRSSFRSYINGPAAGGTTVASDGAEWLAAPGPGKGPFTFPVASAAFEPAPAAHGQIALDGSVYLAGHDFGAGYVLELTLSDLLLDISGSVGTLYADVVYRPLGETEPGTPPGPEQAAQDLAFATIDLSGVTWTPDGSGAYTITDAPAVGIASAMQTIGWDSFYGSEYPNVGLDAFSLTFTPGDQSPLPWFSDVGSQHTFYEQISWMAEHQYADGFPDSTFRPSAPVTRQAMAAFLYRYASPAEVLPGGRTFSDVGPEHTFYEQISWMAAEGISEGYDDGTFRPTEPLTRQAVAAFLYRFAGVLEESPGSDFSDVGPEHTFYEQISWMAAEGISEGYDDGTFGATRTITRQAAAAFLFRYDGSIVA